MKTAKECWISNGLNPDYYIDSVEAAMEEYAAQRTPASGSDGWISVKDRLPDMVEGKDYSNTVFAFCSGDIMVMRYAFVDDGEQYGYVWANCYGDINGDGEWDEDYNVTHWRPLLPSTPNQ